MFIVPVVITVDASLVSRFMAKSFHAKDICKFLTLPLPLCLGLFSFDYFNPDLVVTAHSLSNEPSDFFH